MTWGVFWNVYRTGTTRSVATLARGNAARVSQTTRSASSTQTAVTESKETTPVKKSFWETPIEEDEDLLWMLN
ncbi:hypothetical protein MHU86_20502 [Fragilaria crotonensis]|nr:hypothetical protein MHU86_20502 [Fragilaria crotonensis]